MQELPDKLIDAPYAFNRELGPFARLYPAQYLGMRLGVDGMYPHEQLLIRSNVSRGTPFGPQTLFMLFRYCLN